MFGFGKLPCVICDHLVPRSAAVRIRDHDDLAVCRRCFERWEREGRLCKHCSSPVQGPQDPGIFLNGLNVRRYTFGHCDCGASLLVA